MKLKMWFGRPWSWPALDQKPHVVAPIGQRCGHCGRPILAEDQGMMIENGRRGPIHRDCFYGFVFGHRAA